MKTEKKEEKRYFNSLESGMKCIWCKKAYLKKKRKKSKLYYCPNCGVIYGA